MKPYALQNEDADAELEMLAALSSRSSREPADFCSRDGAVALKQKIEAYWRERGHDVMIALHNVGFHPAIRAARYDVRSDMVNGFPRGKASKPALRAVEPCEAANKEEFAFE